MAAGPIPQQRLEDLDLSRFGFGATGMAPTQLRDGDRWVRPSAGVEWSESVSPSPSPTSTDEAEPQNRRQDQAEAHRIRSEAEIRRAEAESRARGLLVEVIGEPAVQTLEAGGTYAVPSRRWPGTEYHIPKMGYIKIVRGGLWQDVCLVSSDGGLPWADMVLSRIKTIEAHETIVQGKGNKQRSSPNRTLEKIRLAVETVLNPRRPR
jgi:hypothetical protein